MNRSRFNRKQVQELTSDQKMAENYPESFETIFLVALFRSHWLYEQIKDIVSPWDPDINQTREDFSTYFHNKAYRWVDTFYRMYQGSNLTEENGIPLGTFELFLSRFVGMGFLKQDEAEELYENFKIDVEEMPISQDLIHSLPTSPAFKSWIDCRRLNHETNKIISLSRQGYLRKQHLLNSAEKLEKDVTQGSSVYSVDEIMNETIPWTKLIPSGIHDLDLGLGGGFRPDDVVLAAGNTGSGKTTLATQLASLIASNGYKVLYFSTEQKRFELIQRIMSSLMNVPYEEFKIRSENPNDNDINIIPQHVLKLPYVRQRWDRHMHDLKRNLHIADWSTGEKKTIVGNLEKEINGIAEEWRPQVIVFDWLGGALTEGMRADDMRMVYLDGMDHLKRYAKNHSVLVITFAQTNTTQVKPSTKYVRIDHLQESKTMSNKVDRFIGISSQSSGEQHDGQGNASQLSLYQYFYLDKNRNDRPKVPVRVKQDFEYQRYLSISTP